MKLPLSLILQYLNIKESPAKIAEMLTFAGIEVEKIENEIPPMSSVVAGKVEKVEKHPNADSLKIVSVNDGKQTYQVVCGAKNCETGKIYPFAKIGAKITDKAGKATTIKKAKLREVESFGMLCSSQELGLFFETVGLLTLDSSFEAGDDLAEIFYEPVLEISLTPNLGHCLSALGIARELAAIAKKRIKLPHICSKESDEPINKFINVAIESPDCGRYCCGIVQNVKIQPSPLRTQLHLYQSGIRPINNLVDIGNLVMLEIGQPLHIFDYDKIEGKSIRVLTYPEAKNFIGLDKQERKIPENALFIADRSKPIALAGIIGGENSHVDEKTKNLLIESAYFESASIYKTAKSLSLKTESSMRFEKGTDPNMTIGALEYATALIQKETSGKVLKGKVDVQSKKHLPRKITCRHDRINAVLGSHISQNEVEQIFNNLGFELLSNANKLYHLEIPTYRNDISSEIDLIEEVGRIFGYNNIKRINPSFKLSTIYHSPYYLFERQLKDFCKSQNLMEIITCDLISEEQAKINRDPHPIGLKHFKSVEQSVLRSSFLASHLQTIKNNFNHKNFDLAFFETGNLHLKKNNNHTIDEMAALGIILTGKTYPESWDKKELFYDFFDLKGIAENLFSCLGIEDYSFSLAELPIFHPYRQAKIILNNLELGLCGEIDPQLARELDLKGKIYFLEINLKALFERKKAIFKHEEISPFPATERDLTLTLEETISVDSIFKTLKGISSNILEKIFLLDLFEIKDTRKKNVTFRFVYRDKTKTLSFEEAEKEHQKVLSLLQKKI